MSRKVNVVILTQEIRQIWSYRQWEQYLPSLLHVSLRNPIIGKWDRLHKVLSLLPHLLCCFCVLLHLQFSDGKGRQKCSCEAACASPFSFSAQSVSSWYFLTWFHTAASAYWGNAERSSSSWDWADLVQLLTGTLWSLTFSKLVFRLCSWLWTTGRESHTNTDW